MKVSADSCVLEEYILDTVIEPLDITTMYLKHSSRLALKVNDDEAFEELEKTFTDLHFGKANREFE